MPRLEEMFRGTSIQAKIVKNLSALHYCAKFDRQRVMWPLLCASLLKLI